MSVDSAPVVTFPLFQDGNAFAREHKQILGPASLFGERLTSERERMAAQVFQTGYRCEVICHLPVH